MAALVPPQRHVKAENETRNVAVSFARVLDSGELLTGTPTVTEEVTSDLTLANKVVSTAALTINNSTVAIGEAVQFNVAGGTAGKSYKILISVATDASPAQTLVANVHLKVVAD